MTIPFSKTTRSLHSDRFLLRGIWLTFILGLLGFWILWFTQAQISMWSESTQASLRTASDIEAIFPSDAFFQLEIGQAGRVVFNVNTNKTPIFVSATITRIHPHEVGRRVRLSHKY
ncbi:MAG: hypothetical protein AAF633_23495 [Chloroflexota bacterium]